MKLHAIVIGCVCTFLAAAAPAQAGFDVDFGAAVRVGDDTDLYFQISSRYFDRDRATVERWGSRFASPDDLAVALFIGRHSGASLDGILDMRRRGMSWWSISVRLGVPMDAWFVPVRQTPGPPYGKAYGYWKKHGGNPRAVELTDADVSGLVAVRVLHEYFDMPVEAAMERRAGGRDLRKLVTAEYRERHTGKPASAASQGNGKGKAKPQNQGQGGNKVR